ncbi:MAG: UvrD-helicase domain-containing protein, partial [Clostridia bacterium]|nr:UvrD-helicase domain-containing protein [Clostridia bacterium]
MLGMNWTDAQRAAIMLRECNLLVSAAAGSGKTAVLAERIVAVVREGAKVDDLLVVTFTRAAAAELRVRILNGF